MAAAPRGAARADAVPAGSERLERHAVRPTSVRLDLLVVDEVHETLGVRALETQPGLDGLRHEVMDAHDGAVAPPVLGRQDGRRAHGNDTEIAPADLGALG